MKKNNIKKIYEKSPIKYRKKLTKKIGENRAKDVKKRTDKSKNKGIKNVKGPKMNKKGKERRHL